MSERLLKALTENAREELFLKVARLIPCSPYEPQPTVMANREHHRFSIIDEVGPNRRYLFLCSCGQEIGEFECNPFLAELPEEFEVIKSIFRRHLYEMDLAASDLKDSETDYHLSANR